MQPRESVADAEPDLAGRAVGVGDRGRGRGVEGGVVRRHPDRAGPPRREVAARGFRALTDERQTEPASARHRVAARDRRRIQDRREAEMQLVVVRVSFESLAIADELLDATDGLSAWPEKVLTMQRNWIGRSEGARVKFALEGDASTQIEVFTTRIDTIHGATFVLLGPEHPLVTTLGELVERLAAAKLRPPVIVVVGDVKVPLATAWTLLSHA